LSSKIACVALCCTGIATVAAQSAAPLKLKQTLPLSGVEGRIDHFAFDPTGARLFVCALGNNTVEVLDLRKGERVYSIIGLCAPQGIGYAPELNRLFVANDKGGVCKIYDGKFAIQNFDLMGHHLQGQDLSGTVHATRLTVP